MSAGIVKSSCYLIQIVFFKVQNSNQYENARLPNHNLNSDLRQQAVI